MSTEAALRRVAEFRDHTDRLIREAFAPGRLSRNRPAAILIDVERLEQFYTGIELDLMPAPTALEAA